MTGHIVLVDCDVRGREAVRASPDGARHRCDHPAVFGPCPYEVGAFPAGRGRCEAEQAGTAAFDACCVRGTGRVVPIPPLERTVPAEKR